MRRILHSMVLAFIFCVTITNSYGAESYITEADFANELNGVIQIEKAALQGSNNNLTREKAAQMIVTYLNDTSLAKKEEANSHFLDVTASKGEIEFLSQIGIMNGISETQFAPNQYVTVQEAQNIMNKLNTKLQTQTAWKHGCYAISSSSQMDKISEFDAISFGWSEVKMQDGSFGLSISGGDFSVPNGFEEPLDRAISNGVKTYLMVYFDGRGGQAEALLNNQETKTTLINEMVQSVNSITKDGQTRGFDGITVDFEGFTSSALKAPYISFLNELKASLAIQNKGINVAVQPSLYYKGYDYKEIGEVADHVILMAHDYGATTLNSTEMASGMTTTPITPIDKVYLALKEAKMQIADTSKIALQFSFGSLQWQKQNQTVINPKAYTPSYDKIIARVQKPGTTVHFDKYTQSTYATYEENGISNVIWYEDTKSIGAKMELAKLLGINSFSYWRLGTIPNYIQI